MNKQRTLVELANIESLLRRQGHPYFTVVAHYRHWLDSSGHSEADLLETRLKSLFAGHSSLNDVHIELEVDELTEWNGERSRHEEKLNAQLQRMRLSLYEALEEPSPVIIEEEPEKTFEEKIKKSWWQLFVAAMINSWLLRGLLELLGRK